MPGAERLTVKTDKDSYASGETVTVTGKLTARTIDQSLLLQVFDAHGVAVRGDSVDTAGDGSFSYRFPTGGTMAKSGIYNVRVSYGSILKAETTFDFETTDTEIILIVSGASSRTTDAYSPNPVAVKAGDTVTWINDDSTTHTVTSGTGPNDPDKGKEFDSSPNFKPIIVPNAQFSHTFEKEGEFPYFCTLHPNMVGTIRVHGRTLQKDDKQGVAGKENRIRTAPRATTGEIKYDKRKVFIVHGHDSAVKYELASFLRQLGLNPIILHEKPNEGKTVIEKLEKHSNRVGYAFVLLTPDDKGGKDKRHLKPRARQNVILELGIFMGKLERKRVCCLLKEGVEQPSDIHGMLYIAFKKNLEECKMQIIQELKKAGYDV